MSLLWNSEQRPREERQEAGIVCLFTGTGSIRLRGLRAGNKIGGATFGLVETREKIRAACNLVNERYLWRGYGGNHRLLLDAYHATFTAEVGGEVVGTITLATDSRNGLAADRTFQEELDRYRAQPGAKLCELTKFAFNSSIRSQEMMAALFHIVFVYGHRSYGCTDLFIEVNPRHARFYEAMLGFERVGPVRENESVHAPAQLMWLKVASIREQINAVAGKAPIVNQRSLYRLFFSPAEEDRIYERLVAAKTVAAESNQTVVDLAAQIGQPTPKVRPCNAEPVERSMSPAAESLCYA